MRQEFYIKNLHCAGCAARVEEALLSNPAITLAHINMDSRILRIDGQSMNIQEVQNLVGSVESGVSIAPISDEESEEDVPEQGEIQRIIFSACLFAAGIIYEGVFEGTFSPSIETVFLLICYAIPYLLCGYNVLRQAFQGILRGDIFNEFTLMGGATIAAIAIGEYQEAVGVMLFYCLGEYLQEKAAGKSRKSIEHLLAARPNIAHAYEGEKLVDKSPEEITTGTRIAVFPGEKIPLDGTVYTGVSQVDASPLTGESLPVEIGVGSQVQAGTINLGGNIVVEVTAPFTESSIARVLAMVEDASARKAPTERFITRFARYYTPAVVFCALLVALIPPLLFQAPWQEWIYKSLILLVISCPCALLISIPLGYFGGIGAASRRGILVKGGHVFDDLRHINIIGFDKTGTLTKGRFSVTQLIPAEGVTPEELLHTAALAESRSNHPIARSIIEAAPELRNIQEVEIQELPGRGIRAQYQNEEILAGNKTLLHEYGLSPITFTGEGSAVHVAKGNQVLGVILVDDTVRPESAQTIATLKEMGITSIAMLTGDRISSAQRMAQQLGIDIVKAPLLPEDKVQAMQELGDTHNLLFAGDGINDAPVLTTAGVGIAMGGLGSEVAIESAAAIILVDSPARIPELLRIGKQIRAIIWQTIVLANSIKLLFIDLGIAGLSGLWEAIFADVGVALLCVLNATRALKA